MDSVDSVDSVDTVETAEPREGDAMKVVMVVGMSTGGIGGHVTGLTRALRRQGHEVTVITSAQTAEAFDWTGVVRLWPSPRHPIKAVGKLSRFRAVVGDADVVHAHGLQAGVAALTLGSGGPAPTAVSLHNEIPDSAAGRLVGRYVCQRADLVTGASRDLVEIARELGARHARLGPVPAARVRDLLADPLPTEDSRASLRHSLTSSHPGAGLDASRPWVVSVSRVAPQKNLSVLVQAAAIAAQRGRQAQWVHVGSGATKDVEALRAAALRQGADLVFLNRIPDPTDLLRAGSVLALSSDWEARALVVQEAMAAGLPVAAPAVGGLPELVGTAAVLVAPRDPGALADAVLGILADPHHADALAQAARRTAQTWPDDDDTAHTWATWYGNLLAVA